MLQNPFKKDGTLELDPERKYKVLEIAKHLKKSCYELSVARQDGEWLVVCTGVIDGTVYQSANTIDAFTARDHADLFRMAFSNALKDYEKAQSKIVTIH